MKQYGFDEKTSPDMITENNKQFINKKLRDLRDIQFSIIFITR